VGTYALSGGASGIGAAIKQQLQAAGHRTIVVDRVDADITADLACSDDRRSAVAAVGALAPQGLDGFVACAGVGPNTADPRLIALINYFGSVELVAGLRPLVASKGGAMVLVSSNSASMGPDDTLVGLLLDAKLEAALDRASALEGQPVYSSTKLALARWMRRHSAEYAAGGVRLNAVAPGYIRTPMTAAVEQDPTYAEAIRQFVASIPVGRAGEAEDVARAVSFLLGPEASFVCGSVLYVDGGHDASFRPEHV
jgi:NAD(P)-dependent dehydrogenase (short-subunit alcohol dehydrogenase family)